MNTPHTFPRRILLAVTGMSPQILTETLYALGVVPGEDAAFIPTEIHLLTTSTGAQEARTALLHPDGGQFHALLADYPQLGKPRFDDSNIHVIRDASGQPLSDIRSPQENASAADTITALMAELTRDPQAALHVSIAGGRKTMGFYLGYAFSLFARPQDELSHILVSVPFESHPDFYFPPATPRRLTTRDNRNIDTADATITLARIPVVRLRHGQPQALLEGQASFGDTVAAIQRSMEPPHLRIELGAQHVVCGGQTVKLAPALVAWLAWWAQQVRQGHGLQHWRSADAEEFLRLYRRVLGPDSDALDKAEIRLKDGMEKEFFEQNNSKLERALKNQLGLAAAPYLLATSGKRPSTRRGLNLPAQAIELLE
ncbi:CRISPR-associated ring nuclease Csm6 [Thauera butanivorans]|uniref:CRISPR-associated ring nuclease Csm6 n=1 Tax=Thauera butanivorans TaxID=86174 RepID=UPI000838C8C4|nr:CRISPR-associated ring nuclease Csm6 [Thauera butanivorans]